MPPATMLPPSDQRLTMGPSLGFAIPTQGMRRKTPSELRQEQLKRNVRLKIGADGEPSVVPSQGSTADSKKTSPRLIDTRVADIFAATKPYERPKFSSIKQMDGVIKNPPVLSHGIREPASRETSVPPPSGLPRRDSTNGSVERVAKHGVQSADILSRFRDVTEMSTAVSAQATGPGVDMVQALKMMAPITGHGLKESAMKPAELATTLHAPLSDAIACKSRTPPVDLSLKLSARFLSADSLHWCHRTTSANEVEGLINFVKKLEERDKENLDCKAEGCAEKQILQRFGAQFCQALFSWVHPSPQCSGLYDMVLAANRGDTRKDPQLTALYQMWEDSFSSLYHMFHHRRCKQFYYCTQQFVVMFVGGDIAGRDKNALNAYWTRSTRGLRRLLKEHGVEFLMPFSSPEADTTTMEELQELTEFEQLHPGQTRLIDASTVLDNSAPSVLVFEGKNVHRLFDFLLNYRFLVGSTNAKEIPILYSPVEFKTATLHAPEVKCKRAEYDSTSEDQLVKNTGGRSKGTGVAEMMYSLELKDPFGGYIPLWVIQGVCKILQESQSTGFEASFNTGPLTEILNVAQTITMQEAGSCVPGTIAESKPSDVKSTNVKDIAELQNCKLMVIKQLKFSQGYYETSVKSSR